MSAGEKEATASGISYQIRKTQFIDAVILTGVVGIFACALNTDRNVAKIVARQELEDKLEDRDPVIRQSRYQPDMAAVNAKLESTDARVQRLEKTRQ